MSNKAYIIDIIVKHLEGDKEKFLSDLHQSIKSHVTNKSPWRCLELLTSRNGYTKAWHVTEGVPYVLRLIAYLRKKDYKEDGRVYTVDSALTGEVLEIITKKMIAVIDNHKDLLSDLTMAEILLNDETQQQLINSLLEGKSAKIIMAKGKSMIVAALLHAVQQKLHYISSSVASQLGDKITHVLVVASKTTIVTSVAGTAAKVIATTSGKAILVKLSIAISKTLTPLIAKLLAMPAIKIALKKIIVAAVISSITKIVAAKIGMSVGAAIWVVLIPIIAAFLIKDIFDLPSKLGVALADTVTTDIKTNYTKTITEVITELVASLTSGKIIDEIGKNLGDDPETVNELNKLIAAVSTGAVS